MWCLARAPAWGARVVTHAGETEETRTPPARACWGPCCVTCYGPEADREGGEEGPHLVVVEADDGGDGGGGLALEEDLERLGLELDPVDVGLERQEGRLQGRRRRRRRGKGVRVAR